MCCAAMTCGMPLPCAREHVARQQEGRDEPGGADDEGNPGAWRLEPHEQIRAKPARVAKPIAMRATRMAPIQNTKRRSHCRGETRGRRANRRSRARGRFGNSIAGTG